ncbi:MAG TPA: hypothetical protein VJQ82_20870 [Terriglobales bacterium]|nr:hypothetical protein [Terriglobales bacterium]
MQSNRDKTPTNFLNGWKEIATYMGKGVRTVQRYEHQLALPVRRPAGKLGGSVVATKAEIDAWVKASPIHSEFPLVAPARDARLVVTVRSSIAEMHQLREQTAALRDELRTAVHRLETTVLGLHGQPHPEQAPGSPWRRKPN